MAKIHIVGAGPGSPEYVTPIARKIVQKAQLVIGSERILELFRSDIKGEALALTAKNFKQIIRYAVECAGKGVNVALISTGDPGFAGLLGTVAKSVDKDIDLEVTPGISAVQVCAARLRISWDDAVLISFHEGADEHGKRRLLEAVKSGKTIIILPDPKCFTPKDIAQYLISHGANGETPVFICENLTLEDEKVSRGTLRKVPLQGQGTLCVMAIIPSVKPG
ncbi:MAG: precorrin-6y C5,15-methyltransferase (decarboxylating) subunit CbiE [Candidatus Bathyarchaeota archaeon]|nr:precorrin-6y C5,15-methyltransferase (decarboxylating) subunit CbiE [Candidatus Bathyarchaeota archaeon]